MRKGQKMSLEAKAMISYKLRGRKFSAEHVQRMLLSRKEQKDALELLKVRLPSLIKILEERVDPASPLGGLIAEVEMLMKRTWR